MKTPEIVEDYIKKKQSNMLNFQQLLIYILEILYPQNDKRISTIESVGLSF